MDIRRAFPSKYISAGDLNGKTVRVTISGIKFEKMKNRSGAEEQKPVLFFKEAKKGLVLNKTNSDRIAHVYGWETGSWTGKILELYSAEVDAFGEQVEAVRVRVPVGDAIPPLGATHQVPQRQAAPPQRAPQPPPPQEEVPFGGDVPPPTDEFSDLPPEDEIPF